MVAAALPLLAVLAFSFGGYVENRSLFYPREGETDGTQYVNESFARLESAATLPGSFRLFAGVDAQIDTHHQVEHGLRISWDDRGTRRPALAVRTLFVRYARGPVRLEAGKQVVRWGVMSLFSPTDRFASRDYLSPSGSDYLGVWSARAVVDKGEHSLELLYLPRFTPSRMPLTDQRWVVAPGGLPVSRFRLTGTRFPGGPQFGVRYHRVQSQVEYSVSLAEGYYHLPTLPYQLRPLAFAIDYQRIYPKFRMAGGDVTVAWRGLLWKGESAYLTSPRYADNTLRYAIEAEKYVDDWHFTGGFVGEHITKDRGFVEVDIARALGNGFTAEATWTPSLKQVLSMHWYVEPTGDALLARIEYSRSLTPALRATAGWNWIQGEKGSTVGQYNRDSYFSLVFRYSF